MRRGAGDRDSRDARSRIREERQRATRRGRREGRVARRSQLETDDHTRERLLNVAERLFADRGFKDVTVREICREARANVAAVNYYFGDKFALYRDVLQSAIDRMRATNEAARLAGEGQPPEEQLRRYVSIFTHRLFADRSHTVHRLITREMNDPTPALDALIEQGVRPRMEFLSTLIAGIIGCDAEDLRVKRCVASVWTQPFAYVPNPIAERLGRPADQTPAAIEAIAQHIADFSIAGIRAIGKGSRAR